MTDKKIRELQIKFMASVEEFCENELLVGPVEVTIIDAGANHYGFEYNANAEWVNFPSVLPRLPALLRFTDPSGRSRERVMTELWPEEKFEAGV